MTRGTQRRPIALLITVLMFAGTSFAADEIAGTVESAKTDAPKLRKWHLRFGGLVAETNGGPSVIAEPGHFSGGIDAGGGGSVSLERRVSSLIGIEFGLAATGLNINVSAGAGAKNVYTSTNVLIMTPLTLGLNFHVADDGPIDVYAGPLLSYNRFGELSVSTGVGVPRWPFDDDDWAVVRWTGSSELSWGAHAGLGVFFGHKRKWSAQFALTYLDATYDAKRGSDSGRTSVSVDPLMFGFGFGLRF